MSRHARSSVGKRFRRRCWSLERLEARTLLATLAGHWSAGDLDASLASGAAIGSWPDAVSGIAVAAEGNPRLVKNVLNGESVVRFAPEDGLDGFLVPAANSPMSGVGDYAVAVVFVASLANPAPLLVENFDGFTAPPANFNGGQYQSGLPVAFGGNLPLWSKSGGNAVHVVNHAPPPGAPADFAPMIWHDNVITLNSAVAGSNVAGKAYRVDFLASPAVYQAGNQQTSATDGIKIDVLRANGSVLASYVYRPGAWEGNIVLNPGGFEYIGDGSGDVRLRIGPSAPNSGRFGGAIDNLSLREVDIIAPPISGPAWYDHLGLVDANEDGASGDWGVSLTGDGRVAAGVGDPAGTLFSTTTGLGDGRPHVAIVTRSGGTLWLTTDNSTVTLGGVSTSPRTALDMAFGRLLDNRHHFRGDAPLDIGGFHLTDRQTNLSKWTFPTGTTIPAAGQILVFASGLDITDPSLDERGYLHTDFQLDAGGEFLALAAPNRDVLHQYAGYPRQFTDVSYGIAADQNPGFFLSPTPAAANPVSVSTNGPIVSDVTENPGALSDDAELVVTARVKLRDAPIESVNLVYGVKFGAEVTLAMRDDGQDADVTGGDALWSVVVSGGRSQTSFDSLDCEPSRQIVPGV
jgi:hypothetical protein